MGWLDGLKDLGGAIEGGADWFDNFVETNANTISTFNQLTSDSKRQELAANPSGQTINPNANVIDARQGAVTTQPDTGPITTFNNVEQWVPGVDNKWVLLGGGSVVLLIFAMALKG